MSLYNETIKLYLRKFVIGVLLAFLTEENFL